MSIRIKVFAFYLIVAAITLKVTNAQEIELDFEEIDIERCDLSECGGCPPIPVCECARSEGSSVNTTEGTTKEPEQRIKYRPVPKRKRADQRKLCLCPLILCVAPPVCEC
ncbi:hypothetical protein Bhyg_13965 [Pseudolycoriella hygida]|uniref:Uncharacterized protein n=1 Tax=Pseudolycoriella hygida TaxID=35572 RepID=A0A9Q0RV71_9DIPT|nr:hypothetical protein Bhyg_13965 [Pseudolycoriella hygida]